MRVVRFHHHRTTRRQRRGRVAARDRKRQRKIARAEYDYRADGSEHSPKVGLRQRLAARNCAVNARVYPRAFADQISEHPQLIYRAPALAHQTVFQQAAF
jgi:hypothetical protein